MVGLCLVRSAAVRWVVVAALLWASAMVSPCFAADPFAYFDWDVSYTTASPLGVPQRVSFQPRLSLYSLDLMQFRLYI